MTLSSISSLQEIKLKSPIRNLKSIAILNNRCCLLVFSSFFIIFDPVTKSQILQKLPKKFEQSEAFTILDGFVLYEPNQQFGYIFLIDRQNNITTKQIPSSYKSYGMKRSTIYFSGMQKLILYQHDKAHKSNLYQIFNIYPEYNTKCWQNPYYYGQASFHQPLVTSVKSNNKQMIQFKNIDTGEIKHVQFPTGLQEVCFIDEYSLIYTRKDSDKMTIEMKRVEDLPDEFECLLEFPLKTQVQFKGINTYEQIIGILTSKEFFLYDYRYHKVKWSTTNLNKFHHKSVNRIVTCSSDLRDFIFQSKDKIFIHKFVSFRNAYQHVYMKSILSDNYSQGLLKRLTKLLPN